MTNPPIRRRRRDAGGHRSLFPEAWGVASKLSSASVRASLGLGLVLAVLAGPAGAAGLRDLVDQAAIAAGVPAGIAHAVIARESGYQVDLRGSAGEWGLGQIKCATARGVGFRGACGRLGDAATNLKFSMKYLRLALDRGGSGCAGVSLYQRGLGGAPGCSSYGRQVMARAGQ